MFREIPGMARRGVASRQYGTRQRVVSINMNDSHHATRRFTQTIHQSHINGAAPD